MGNLNWLYGGLLGLGSTLLTMVIAHFLYHRNRKLIVSDHIYETTKYENPSSKYKFVLQINFTNPSTFGKTVFNVLFKFYDLNKKILFECDGYARSITKNNQPPHSILIIDVNARRTETVYIECSNYDQSFDKCLKDIKFIKLYYEDENNKKIEVNLNSTSDILRLLK